VRAIPGRQPVPVVEPAPVAAEPRTPEPEVVAGEVGAVVLARWLAERERGERDFVLIDVREPWEQEICRIAGGESMPMSQLRVLPDPVGALDDLTGGRPAVLYCKSGARSGQLLSALNGAGVTGIGHLTGGVLAWIDQVDPGLTRY
jgi:adenylyltransferase/sulfurtransferase